LFSLPFGWLLFFENFRVGKLWFLFVGWLVGFVFVFLEGLG